MDANKKKYFLTIDEQIELLQKRGLTFLSQEDIDTFKWYLTKFNYQNFVNDYNDCFMINRSHQTNRYYDASTSQNIIDLFKFDRDVVSLLINPILNIERMFAHAICYEIMNHNKDIMGDGLIYNLERDQFLRIFPKLKYLKHQDDYNVDDNILELKKTLLGSDNKKLTAKYFDHIQIPLWILSCNWSFGNINHIYTYLSDDIKRIISSKFIQKNQLYWTYTSDFSKIMIMLNSFRNLICHGNVIYNFKYLLKDRSNVALKRFYSRILNMNINNVRLTEMVNLINYFDPNYERNDLINDYIEKIKEFIAKIDDEKIKLNFLNMIKSKTDKDVN